MVAAQEEERELGRWALKLAEYDFKVEHIPGESNFDADCLSRVDVAQIDCSLKSLLEETQKDDKLTALASLELDKFKWKNGALVMIDEDQLRIVIPMSLRKKVWEEFHEKLGHVGPVKVLDSLRCRCCLL